jgi:hypothetical protein
MSQIAKYRARSSKDVEGRWCYAEGHEFAAPSSPVPFSRGRSLGAHWGEGVAVASGADAASAVLIVSPSLPSAGERAGE